MTAIQHPQRVYRPLGDDDAEAGIAIIHPWQPTPLAARFTELLRAESSPQAPRIIGD